MTIRVLLFIVLFLSAPVGSIASEPLRIGFTVALTGQYSSFGDMQLKGYRLWQRDVNASGGIMGRKVSLVIHDDKSDPERARGLYEKMIKEEKLPLVFAPFSSRITESILPVTERHGYPLLVSGAAADELWQKGYEYIFGMFQPASRMTSGFLDLLVMHGLDDIAIVYAEDSFSMDVSWGTRKWADVLGLNVVLSEGPLPGNGNYADTVRKVKDSGARVVVVCGLLKEVVGMLFALDRAGYDGSIYVPVGPGLPSFYDKVGERAENVFSTSQWELHGNAAMPGSREFFDRFVREYGVEPSYFAATAYASGQILYEAINRSGSLHRRKLRDELLTSGFDSIIGRYGVDSAGRQIKNFSLTIQVRGGRTEIVWPSAFVTARPVF